MYNKVNLNGYGYYELKEKPTQKQLEEYYKEQYYQEAKGSYEKSYNESERKYIENKLEQKFIIVGELVGKEKDLKFLDIGCGEGWSLEFFSKKYWDVCGLDYSNFGCKTFNKDYANKLIQGDIEQSLKSLQLQKKKFDCIYVINVLEHVLEPYNLLKDAYDLLSDRGVIVIQVPNDFSVLHKLLINNNIIDDSFWVQSPDRISYFNISGLTSLCDKVGLKKQNVMSDFPIDFNILNEKTNYIKDKSQGRNCHNVRIELENFFSDISNEKTNNLYESLADMGLGRNITLFCSKY